MIFNSCFYQIGNYISLSISNNDLLFTLNILDFNASDSLMIQYFQLSLLGYTVYPDLFLLFLLTLNQLSHTTK